MSCHVRMCQEVPAVTPSCPILVVSAWPVSISKTNKEHVIAYWSWQLQIQKQNTTTLYHYREALTVMLYPYLQLHGFQFTLVTDNNHVAVVSRSPCHLHCLMWYPWLLQPSDTSHVPMHEGISCVALISIKLQKCRPHWLHCRLQGQLQRHMKCVISIIVKYIWCTWRSWT